MGLKKTARWKNQPADIQLEFLSRAKKHLLSPLQSFPCSSENRWTINTCALICRRWPLMMADSSLAPVPAWLQRPTRVSRSPGTDTPLLEEEEEEEGLFSASCSLTPTTRWARRTQISAPSDLGNSPAGFNTYLSASIIRLRLRMRKASSAMVYFDVEGVEGVKWFNIKEEEKDDKKGESGDRDSALAFVLFMGGVAINFSVV